jgi:hypothetical protein
MLVYALIAVTFLIWFAVLAIWLIGAVRGGPEPIMVTAALGFRQVALHAAVAAPAENPRMLLPSLPPGSQQQHSKPLPAPHFILNGEAV